MSTRFDDLRSAVRRRSRLLAMPVDAAARSVRPVALFITCSDSRIVPGAITATTPGELCELRSIGCRIPTFDATCPSAEAATVEYAIRHLGVRHVIVCGHSDCDALAGKVLPELPATADWLAGQVADGVPEDALAATIDRAPLPLQSDYGPDGVRFVGPRTTVRGAGRHRAGYGHVLHQLGALRTHPAIADGLATGRVELHGWYYDLTEGSVTTYDAGVGAFVPL
ncbi:hypothetical protein GCM10010472_30520 [Pseudonocardia halophobica]|uniref:carbonic anhydrase n=1 Tax=Pseudonocardia halophobica TaxID=29401 RepID=A0A9W6NUD3_9PSEU|nr:carbonic anhydrase [Pseudonocardia halophobica]GLL09311.1 hypothetical protein GCM10017577_04510 [Pseudonocardia halophobica]